MTEFAIILVAVAVACLAISVAFGGKIKALFGLADAEVGTLGGGLDGLSDGGPADGGGESAAVEPVGGRDSFEAAPRSPSGGSGGGGGRAGRAGEGADGDVSIVRASGKSKKGAYKIGEGEGTVDVIAPGEGRSDDQDGHSIGDGERVGESRWGRRRRRGDGAGERGSDPAPEVGFSVGRGLLLALLLIGGLLLGRFALGGKGGDG